MDPFEAFFRQADVDGDGRISGMEAIAFFRGSGLPQIVLAKIWQLSDQEQLGFLTKPQFIYALKLVTVAQSGRELTPEIARAALSGTVSTQIPPPRIVPAQGTVPPPSPPPAYRPPLQNQRVSYNGPSPVATTAPDGFGGPSFQAAPKPVATGVSSSSNLGDGSGSLSFQAAPGPGAAISPSLGDGFGGSSFQAAPRPVTSQASISSGLSGSAFQATTNPVQSQGSSSLGDVFGGPGFQATSKSGSITSSALGDGFGGSSFQAFPDAQRPVTSQVSTSGPSAPPAAPSAPTATAGFGGDTFKASRPMLSEDFGGDTFTASQAIVPVATHAPNPTAGLGTAIVPATPLAPATPLPMQVPSSPARPYAPPVQNTWPKMTQGDIERYSQVFASVDSDRDGKVRGEQARDVFLSWGLPRDILKRIWDLSDQDGDSMLSLREFCIAVYFMERYREGRPPPSVLPMGFLPETPAPPQQFVPGPVRPPVVPLQQPTVPVVPARPQQQEPGTGTLPGSQAAGLMPLQATPDAGPAANTVQYKSRAPPLEPELVRQLNKDDQHNLKSKYQEAEMVDRKVFDLDKDIKHATEMIEFYRAKLQEIILFKTRTDNHLLEITERLAADKREVEALRKRYDQKFQQAGETNSRLLAEEAAFHDIQVKRRKMDVYNVIAKLDQNAKKDGLQEHAEEISNDLNELKTLLNQRAKKLGLRSRPTSAMELPFGWQPSIQENAVDWDDWDKFDDEGYSYFQHVEETTKPVDETKSAEEDKEAAEGKKVENGPTENGSLEGLEEKHLDEDKKADSAAVDEKADDKTTKPPEETPIVHDEAPPERKNSVPDWSSVFGDEPAWNLSQDFGKNAAATPTPTPASSGGFMGLKAIKTSTSAASVAGDASVPETPLFSTLSPPAAALDDQRSVRGGDESVPETPLFKSPDQQSRSSFARFDSFDHHGIFDDPGTSFDGTNRWSTF